MAGSLSGASCIACSHVGWIIPKSAAQVRAAHMLQYTCHQAKLPAFNTLLISLTVFPPDPWNGAVCRLVTIWTSCLALSSSQAATLVSILFFCLASAAEADTQTNSEESSLEMQCDGLQLLLVGLAVLLAVPQSGLPNWLTVLLQPVLQVSKFELLSCCCCLPLLAILGQVNVKWC